MASGESYFVLPKKEEHLVGAVDDLVRRGEIERNLMSVEWFIAHYYLQGVRDFEITWTNGNGFVRIPYENRKGELLFTYEGLLYQYRVELGRLMGLNMEPVVGREGFGLDSVRKSGMGQATLSFMDKRGGKVSSKNKLSRLCHSLLKYGFVAMNHYRCAGQDIGDRTATEVVPPWEVLSVPAEPDTIDEVRGVIRHRDVPAEWVRSLELERLAGATDDDLGVVELPFGETPQNQSPEDWGGSTPGATSSAGGESQMRAKRREQESVQFSKSREKGKKDKSGRYRKEDEGQTGTQKWVTMSEVFLFGPKENVERYIVRVGRAIGDDKSYEKRISCPLNIARYYNTGRFYGRGFVGSMLSLNSELERVIGNTFQNVSDMDQYGMVVIPRGSGISRRDVEKPERRKFLFAEPDPVNPRQEVYSVAANNTGDFPAKIVGLGVELAEKISGQSSAILSGGSPGRVDSASALGFLHETGNINLVAPINEIADLYVATYTNMLQAARRELSREKEEGGASGFPLPFIDDRMIGVALNEDGSISLDDNVIPEPWEVDIDVAERMLVSKEQTKQEAVGMLQQGLMTPVHFRILNEKHGWNFPVVSRGDWEAYRKMTFTKIMLYNDGVTPGQVVGGIEFDRPDIALEVLGELMASVEFTVASPEVRDAFIELKSRYEEILGVFPNDMNLPGQEEEQQAEPTSAEGGGGPPIPFIGAA